MVGSQDRGRDRLLHRSRRRAGAGHDAALECPDSRAVQRPLADVRPGPGSVDPVAHLAAGREPLAPRRRLAPRTVAAALRGETPGHDAGGARALQAGVAPPLRVVACPRARAEARALTCAERRGDLRDRRVTHGATGPPPAAGDTVSPRPSLDPSRPARL